MIPILVLGQTHFVGSKFGIFVGFWWVCSSILVDKPGGLEEFKVRFFQIWAWVRPISGHIYWKSGLFGGVKKGSNIGFGG